MERKWPAETQPLGACIGIPGRRLQAGCCLYLGNAQLRHVFQRPCLMLWFVLRPAGQRDTDVLLPSPVYVCCIEEKLGRVKVTQVISLIFKS